jgi:hypothetical protein
MFDVLDVGPGIDDSLRVGVGAVGLDPPQPALTTSASVLVAINLLRSDTATDERIALSSD